MKYSKRKVAAVLSGCLVLGQVTPAVASPDIAKAQFSDVPDETDNELGGGQ